MKRELIDIRNKARELSKKFGKLSPYSISCGTLIEILDELEAAQILFETDAPSEEDEGDSIPYGLSFRETDF